MKRKKVSKLSSDEVQKMRKTERHWLTCKCGREVECDSDTIEIVCWECATKLAPPAENLLRPLADIKAERDAKAQFPAGWKFMKVFVLKDGTVYERGVENPELKGTLPPTDVDALKKERKKNKKGLKQKLIEKESEQEELAQKHFEAKKEQKKAKKQLPIVGTDIPTISTNRPEIIANVSLNPGGFYEAIDEQGIVNYTALVNDQKKLKYVFNNSKKIIGKRNEDGTYNWRGCK